MELISREQAIETFKDCAVNGVGIDGIVDALEQLPLIQPVNNSEMPNSSDVISRQKAIDALRAMQTYKLFAGDDMLLIDQAGAQTELMLLPPIQPEIVRCKDCKNYKFGMCLYSMTSGVGKLPNGFCDWAERREVNHESN